MSKKTPKDRSLKHYKKLVKNGWKQSEEKKRGEDFCELCGGDLFDDDDAMRGDEQHHYFGDCIKNLKLKIEELTEVVCNK
jgi:hypothetical protein